MQLKYKLTYGIIGVAVATSFIAAPLALANKGEQGRKDPVTPRPALSLLKAMNVMVAVDQNGKVEIHGATVNSTSSSGFVAKTVWGSTTLMWNVTVGSTTQVTDKDGRKGDKDHKQVQLADIQVGDIVDFNGQLDTSASSPTVVAQVVHDRSSVVTPKPNVKDVFQGVLQAVASSSAPTTLSVKVGGDLYTVVVSAATAIINNAFASISLSTLQAGDTLRIYGLSNASSSISALVVRDASR